MAPGGCKKNLRADKLRVALLQKSLGVPKILVRKIWFYSPPPRKGPKMRKNYTNQYKILKIDTFSRGGNAILWTNDFMDIWAFLIVDPHLNFSSHLTLVCVCGGDGEPWNHAITSTCASLSLLWVLQNTTSASRSPILCHTPRSGVVIASRSGSSAEPKQG